VEGWRRLTQNRTWFLSLPTAPTVRHADRILNSGTGADWQNRTRLRELLAQGCSLYPILCTTQFSGNGYEYSHKLRNNILISNSVEFWPFAPAEQAQLIRSREVSPLSWWALPGTHPTVWMPSWVVIVFTVMAEQRSWVTAKTHSS